MEETGFCFGRRLLGLMLLCILITGGVFAGMCYVLTSDRGQNTERQEQVIALNEIEKLTEQNGVSPAGQQIQSLKEELAGSMVQTDWEVRLLFLAAGVLVIGMVMLVFGTVWYMVVRPFQKLERFAGEVAKGNLELSLEYERNNLFGAFTWAFDHMRREIRKARACEKEAIENNKTVIATLSHDIKSPVASIRAYAEGLEANMDTTWERRQRYLTVIMKKCDEVTALTNDLFLHSLSDLNKLQITVEAEPMKELLEELLNELNGERGDLIYRGELHSATVCCDRKRVTQAVENIVNNARKYADKPGIIVWTELVKENQNVTYKLHIKDSGEGILPEDMPFIFEKFYRGKNNKNVPGAGLGLYIVKYVMEQMNGRVLLFSDKDGLEAVLEFPVTEHENG